MKYLEEKAKKKVNLKAALIGVVLLVFLLAMYGVNLKNDKRIEEKERYETSFTSEKRYGILRITDIEKTTDHLNAYITNTTDTAFEGDTVDVVFLSDMGDVLCRSTYVIPLIEAHNKASLNIVMEQKCKNAYTFVLEKKEEDKDE